MREASDGYTVSRLAININEEFMHLDELWLIQYFILSPTQTRLTAQIWCDDTIGRCQRVFSKQVHLCMSITCPKDTTSPIIEYRYSGERKVRFKHLVSACR